MAFPPRTQAELLELWRSLFPISYTEPIDTEANGQGLDVFSQQAAQLARVADGEAVTTQAYYLKPHSTQVRPESMGERRATGSVQITRSGSAAGGIVLLDGTEFVVKVLDPNGVEQDGERFRAVLTFSEFFVVAGSTTIVIQFAAGTFSAVNVHAGRLASIGGQVGVVSSNTLSALTLSTPLSAAPAAGVRVVIFDQAIAPGATSLTLPIAAVRPGYQGNVPVGRITAFADRGAANITATTEAANVVRDNGLPDRFSPSQVGQYLRFTSGANASGPARLIAAVTQGALTSFAVVDGAPVVVSAAAQDVEVVEFADLGLAVSQPDETTGGRHGWLDAIGRDRRAGRAPGESDSDYRDRLCALEDVVSPGAIARAVARVLTPLGIGYSIHETRDVNGLAGLIWWDGGTGIPSTPSTYGHLSALDLYTAASAPFFPDDPNIAICNGQVYAPPVRFFVVCVGVGGQGEFGFPYDTPFPNNAWDLAAFDGFAIGYHAALGALYDAVERARAAGIGWELVLDTTL